MFGGVLLFAWLGPLVLVAAALGAFVLYAFTDGDDASAGRTYATYLFAAVFVTLLLVIVGVGGLAGALGQAVTDRPGGVACAGGSFDRIVAQPQTPAPPQPPDFDFRPPEPPSFEFEPPTFPQVPSPQPIPFEPPEFDLDFPQPEPIDFTCEPGSGRKAAAASSVRWGAFIAVSGVVLGAHARQARKLFDEEGS